MKILTHVSLLAAALAAVGLPLVSAAPKSLRDDAPGRHGRMHAATHKHKHAVIAGQIAKRLDLTPEQKAALKTKRGQTVDALKALRADPTLTREQKKAKARETVRAARTEMRAALNAEQQAKLDRVRKHLKKRADKGRA